MIGHTARQRTARRVLAAMLFGAAAAFFFSAPSEGYASCTRDVQDDSELNIVMAATADSVFISRTSGGTFVIATDAGTPTSGTTGTSCGGATILNISEVNVFVDPAQALDQGTQTVTIDLSNGLFGAGSLREIVFDIDLGDGTVGGPDEVIVRGGVNNENIALGTQTGTSDHRINLDTTETVDDADVTLLGVEKVSVDLGGGANKAVGTGAESGADDDFGISMEFRTGAGNDTFTGGDMADTFQQGSAADGHDVMIGGLGTDHVNYGSRTTSLDVTLDNAADDGADGEGDNVKDDIENVTTGSGNDYLEGPLSLTIGNKLNGGGGTDEVDYSARTNGVRIDVSIAANTSDADDGESCFGTGTCEGDDIVNTEILRGGAGDDDFLGGGGAASTMFGNGGRDELEGNAFADSLDGGPGNDTLNGGGGGADVLTGGPDNDTLEGVGEKDILDGGEGTDTLYGGGGSDTLKGGVGADTLNGETVTDPNESSSTDVASYEDRDEDVHISIDGVANDGEGCAAPTATTPCEGDSLVKVERVLGGDGDDTLIGDDNANILVGGPGNDTIDGGPGPLTPDPTVPGLQTPFDQLDGSGGDGDTVSYASAIGAVTVDLGANSTTTQQTGGGGDDRLAGFENVIGSPNGDVLKGNASANVLQGGDLSDVLVGRAGDDTLDGGDGEDLADYNDTSTTAGVTVDLAVTIKQTTVGAGGDILAGIENLQGSQSDDRLSGDANANKLYGHAGNDILNGRGAADRLDGGSRNTSEVLVGEDMRIDSASYANAPVIPSSDTGVEVYLDGSQANRGEAEGDSYHSIEGLEGSAFDDVLKGNNNVNRLAGLGGDDKLFGEGGDDILLGGADNDEITGGGGSDTIDYTGVTGPVSVNLTDQSASGEGNDALQTVENATGGNGDDTLVGSLDPNTLTGGPGKDTVSPLDGLDELVGGEGEDTVDYSGVDGPVTASLLAGHGGATGNALDDDTYVGLENLIGTAGADSLTGDSGNNTFAGLGGNDTIDGQGGTDTADYSAAGAGVTVTLRGTPSGSTSGGAGEDDLTAIENVLGSTHDDTLEGSPSDNKLDGNDGNDTASFAGASGVTADLGVTTAQNTNDGNDTLLRFENLTGSPGADTLSGTATANRIRGGGGNDLLNGRAGDDTLDGQGDTDTVTYADAGAGVTVDLSVATSQDTGGADEDTLAAIENATGSAHDDTITGDSVVNLLTGGDGNDTLSGAGGDDTLNGGAGDDTINGGADKDPGDGGDGKDTVNGDAGDDTLAGGVGDDKVEGGADNDGLTGGDGDDAALYTSAGAAVTVDLTNASAQDTLGAGTDTLAGFEDLTGSAHNDTLVGDDNVNTLDGGAGDDTLSGGEGKDALIGGAGAEDTVTYATAAAGVTVNLLTDAAATTDTVTTVENVTGSAQQDVITGNNGANDLLGGDGDDTITGGLGNDTEDGGAGNDKFFQGNTTDGADLLIGGDGTDDLVDYSARPTRASVTRDGVPNDGEAGEGDNVGADVEQQSLASTVPGAPTNVTASAGDRRATVTWAAPANDGGSAITGYVITATPGGTTASTSGSARSAIVAPLNAGTSYTFTVKAVNVRGAGPASAASNAVTPTGGETTPPSTTQGYAFLGSDGGVFNFGAAGNFGSVAGLNLNQPPIGLSYTPTGQGYWIVAQDGGIFSFGDAKFHGSMGGAKLNAPVLGMEPTPTGGGYWLFAADGGIFSFGDARFHGSMGASKLNAPVVGMAATSTGGGYWLVAQDGGIFSFGDARFHGSMGGSTLNQPVFDMAPTADNGGYWLVARDGGIFAFGNARFLGSAAPANPATVIGIGTTPSGNGYWIADRNGVAYAFGDAQAVGDLRDQGRTAVSFAALPK
jgi:Ca2+-binding RTX toxin-like protein